MPASPSNETSSVLILNDTMIQLPPIFLWYYFKHRTRFDGNSAWGRTGYVNLSQRRRGSGNAYGAYLAIEMRDSAPTTRSDEDRLRRPEQIYSILLPDSAA